jgi:hypothetical protein
LRRPVDLRLGPEDDRLQLEPGEGGDGADGVGYLPRRTGRNDHVSDVLRLLARATAAAPTGRDQPRLAQVAGDQLHRLRPVAEQQRHQIGEVAESQHRPGPSINNRIMDTIMAF